MPDKHKTLSRIFQQNISTENNGGIKKSCKICQVYWPASQQLANIHKPAENTNVERMAEFVDGVDFKGWS